jgi:hypothetical protein
MLQYKSPVFIITPSVRVSVGYFDVFTRLLEQFIQNVNGAKIFLFIPYLLSTFVTSESLNKSVEP